MGFYVVSFDNAHIFGVIGVTVKQSPNGKISKFSIYQLYSGEHQLNLH